MAFIHSVCFVIVACTSSVLSFGTIYRMLIVAPVAGRALAARRVELEPHVAERLDDAALDAVLAEDLAELGEVVVALRASMCAATLSGPELLVDREDDVSLSPWLGSVGTLKSGAFVNSEISASVVV